jgi:hypothetical protein
MDTKDFLQFVASGQASKAQEVLSDMLSQKAFEALDIKKQQIAQTLYNDGENIEVQDTADTPVEEIGESSDGYEVKQSKTDPDVHHVHYKGKKIGYVYGNKKGMWGHEYEPMGTGDHGHSSKKEAVNAVKDDHLHHLNMKEEVEQIDEVGDTPAGKKMLGSYLKKRTKQLPNIERNYQMTPYEDGPMGAKTIKKFQKKVNKGMGRAIDRLTK